MQLLCKFERVLGRLFSEDIYRFRRPHIRYVCFSSEIKLQLAFYEKYSLVFCPLSFGFWLNRVCSPAYRFQYCHCYRLGFGNAVKTALAMVTRCLFTGMRTAWSLNITFD